jgi:hypothetical protein
MLVLEAIQAPPPPLYISWRTIFAHSEYSRGIILDLLNKRFDLIQNGNLVACGSALPERITEPIHIPDACFTTFQWAFLANIDKVFFDYGVPLLCLTAIVAGTIIVVKGMNYIDGVGVLHVDEVAFNRARKRKWVEENMREAKKRRDLYGLSDYVPPNSGGDQMRPGRILTPEQKLEHRANWTKKQKALENQDRADAEILYGIGGDTNFATTPTHSAASNPHQEIVREPSWLEKLAGIFKGDHLNAVFASSPRMAHIQIIDYNEVGQDSIFEGIIGESARGDITEDDIAQLEDGLRMTTGITGQMSVNISDNKKKIRITFLGNA